MTLQEMQQHVQEEAMGRYVASLGHEAKEAVAETKLWGRTLQSGVDQDALENRRRRELCHENQLRLQEQIELNKVRRADTRKDYIEAASLHSFPLFTETFISETEVEAYRKRQKEQWREELDQQRMTNQMLRNIEEKKHYDGAIRRHHENVRSMVRERGLERERLHQQGRELVNAWDREVRLKSLKKAIHSGKDVVHHTAAELARPGGGAAPGSGGPGPGF